MIGELDEVEISIEVKDLLRFFRHLNKAGINFILVEEKQLFSGAKEENYGLFMNKDINIGLMKVRYIDSMYFSFNKLANLLSNINIGENFKDSRYWAVPIEPLKLFLYEIPENLVKSLSNYIDSYPNNDAIKALKYYFKRELSY